MKNISFILYTFLICFQLLLTANVNELKIEEYTEVQISTSSQTKLHYYLSKSSGEVGGVSFYLDNIPQDKIHVYLQDYDSETIAEDYTPSLDGKAEYILHKIHNYQNDNYFLSTFKYASNAKYKIISIIIDNLTSGTPVFKIAGIELRSSIPIIGQSVTNFIRVTENIPTLIAVKITKTSHHGLSFIFFIPSRIEQLKVLSEDNLSDGEVLLLNKAEVISYPNFGDNNLITYYAIIYSSKNERVKLNCVFSEYQTLYFANKEERTNDRSYDVKVYNAYEKFFALGEYESESDSLIYLEEVFGGTTAYYSNNLDGKTIKNMLPDVNDGVKLNNDFLRVYSDLDILTVYCDSMCMFNLHIISMKSINLDTTEVGKTKYILLNKYIQSVRTIEIIDNNPTLGDLFYEVASIDCKDISFQFFDENNSSVSNNYELNYYAGEYHEEALPRNAKYLTVKTDLGEDVLVVFKVYYKNKYTIYSNEGTYQINSKNILIPFRHDRDYYKIIIDVKTPGTNFLYNVNYGDTAFVCDSDIIIRTANRTNKEHHFEILNPYLTKIGTINKTQSFYYSFTFNDISSMASDSLKISYIEKNKHIVLGKDKINYLTASSLNSLEQNDSKNKNLLLIMNKCNSKVDLNAYLSYNDIDLVQMYLDKNIYTKILDDKQYTFDLRIETNEKKDDFPPIHFYYTYIDKDNEFENSLYANIANEDFSVEYKYELTENNSTIFTWGNILAKRQSGNVNYTYEIYTFKDEKSANSCDQLDGKFITSFVSNSSVITQNITIDRSEDIYVLILMRTEDAKKPQIYYTPIKVFKSSVSEAEKYKHKAETTKTVLIIVIGVSVLVILSIIGFSFWYIKTKTPDYNHLKNQVNSMEANPYGTSLVVQTDSEKGDENSLG